MGRGSPSKTRTGSRKTLCAPSSQRPRVSVRTGGDGGSSPPDPTPRLSRLKVEHTLTFSFILNTLLSFHSECERHQQSYLLLKKQHERCCYVVNIQINRKLVCSYSKHCGCKWYYCSSDVHLCHGAYVWNHTDMLVTESVNRLPDLKTFLEELSYCVFSSLWALQCLGNV